MAIACVVLDFDGTFTDVAAESAPFLRHFRQGLAAAVGEDLESAWEEEVAALRAGADALGWDLGGRVVAPATADPYLTATCAAHRLMQRFGQGQDEARRSDVVQKLYREAYAHSATAFKPEAKEVLEALVATGLPVTVVTNAHTDLVEKKLDQLAPKGREKLTVSGDARKFLLDPPDAPDARFTAVPETQTLDGVLRRPVYLRRGRYFQALKRVWEATGTTPEQTLVAGDIYELDLALPAALGAHVQLVARDNVLPYELKAMELLGARGGVDRSLHGVLPRLR
ncbi:HAD family hydrolase [Myxococcus sp. AM009]|uniref:HAD family hydrolase n=1 Tax=unclassified Myxococcus TaxID=2648731 RepID=UPI00159518DA|nr:MULTISPECIES: HAD family hydrolase [unclassified Myxococcus]NVJ02497.1 HAD family hydrolase [Myxococcus sp. AM009]NVJ18028.1 HAD family hydrolase [Myxococcus sp. AM010]